MSIAATFQRAYRVKKLDPYPMEILKRVGRPTTQVMEDVGGELTIPTHAGLRGNFKEPKT